MIMRWALDDHRQFTTVLSLITFAPLFCNLVLGRPITRITQKPLKPILQSFIRKLLSMEFSNNCFRLLFVKNKSLFTNCKSQLLIRVNYFCPLSWKHVNWLYFCDRKLNTVTCNEKKSAKLLWENKSLN